MPTYKIQKDFVIRLCAEVEVEADSEEEAIDRVQDSLDYDIDLDWIGPRSPFVKINEEATEWWTSEEKSVRI